MLIISLIINITLLALMLYYKKMYKIEIEKNQKLLTRIERSKSKKSNDVNILEKETQKIMRQTGLTYELALQIAKGEHKISVKNSNDKVNKPFNPKI